MTLVMQDVLISKNTLSNKDVTTSVPFTSIEALAHHYCRHLQVNKDLILSILMQYETYTVACDEFDRTVDLLTNINENKNYFGKKTKRIKTFLPQNQPLYAFTCFGVVPSFQTHFLEVRPPQVSHRVFRELIHAIKVSDYFPHIEVNYEDKHTFAKKNAKNTNVVIFTGSSETGLNLRKLFPQETLFILNGSGHNPLIITEDADLDLAVKTTLKLCLFNQGQDCSAPSAILVHQNILNIFEKTLIENLRTLESKIGPYSDKNNIVGPNTKESHVVKVADFFRKNKHYCIYGGNINPVTQLIFPTIFSKPLTEGPFFEEHFAPIITLQSYSSDNDLSLYFEHPRYFQNAMYVTVFGNTPYILKLKELGLHLDKSIIFNSNIQDIERGFLEYGGQGPRASCIYWRSQKISGATLPQRDIFKYILNPKLQ